MWAMCDLVGKVIEIRGELNESDDRAEIVLENARKLKGQAATLPPMARNFDVEQRGHFSAGKSRATHGRSTRQKRQRPTLPINTRRCGDGVNCGCTPPARRTGGDARASR